MRDLCSKQIVLAVAAMLTGLAGNVFAENGTVHTLAGAGLTMTIDTRWVSGGGYRPVKIDVVPTRPVPADRTLTVQFVVNRYWSGSRKVDRTVERIEIPAFSGPIQTTLSVPDQTAWNTYVVNVLEDGKLIPGFSTTGPGDMSGGVLGLVFPAILFVGNAPPDTTEMAKLFPVEAYNQFSPQGIAGASGLPIPTAIARPAGELPERWIDYSSLDLVYVSLAELESLSRQRPRAFRAIVEWTAAGGNLVVYGIGRDGRGLTDLEALVGLPASDASGEAVPAAGGWQPPVKALYGRKLSEMGFQDSSGGGYGQPYYGLEGDSGVVDRDTEFEPPPAPDEPPFVVREFDRGMLVAMASRSPFPGNEYQWCWLLGTLGSNRVLWYQRHGLSTTRENRDFWQFLIPGVGLAPVGGFRVLITLFVIAIGPVNYFVLRRLKRLHLLLLTTPACAAAVTGLLFGYAIVADGLGTQVRVRSATHIDQRARRAVCWSRLSYYAGLAPSGGLTFPGDVVVTPLEYIPVGSRPSQRELIWQDEQRLVSGWLPSRTPTQFLTVRARPSEHRIEIVAPPSESESEGLRIENRLGTTIYYLVLRTKDGRYWRAMAVTDGASAVADSADAAAEFRRMADVDRRLAPSYPPGMDHDGPGVSDSLYYSRHYWMWRYARMGTPPPTQDTGRLEDAISALHRHAAAAPLLEPGSYVAIIERSPEVVLGTESAEEVGGFHLVTGTW